jgi:acyl transferase domain-containing protein
MSGRFPGAASVNHLWNNLVEGAESIIFFSNEELIEAGVDPSVLSDSRYVKAGGVLADIEMFDAALFGYSPREAEVMDPQHRLFLECAWEALEIAGYDSEHYEGSVGVFGGSNISTYLLGLHADAELYKSLNPLQTALGNANDSLTTKVSYKLNLRGPEHRHSNVLFHFGRGDSRRVPEPAERVVRHGAGGRGAGRRPASRRLLLRDGRHDSPDGHCRAFDAKGQGAVLGNGVAIVVLKRLEEAVADGDQIYAVIKGSAINNDGSLKVGYTAPSVEGQSHVISQALVNAGVEADSISYVEAHGTGTELGDPIEFAALTKAFRQETPDKSFCAVGSVKTNLGHLDRAAGATSLIKTALALKHKIIPPSLHFSEPSPKIDFENSPFFVNTALREWERNGTPRRAGVNALGIGGTNVHFILEEAPELEPSGASRPYQLLTLSAHTSGALDAATTNLVEFLRHHPTANLADVAYTLQVGRRILGHKSTLVCHDIDDAIAALESRDPQTTLHLLPGAEEPPRRLHARRRGRPLPRHGSWSVRDGSKFPRDH